MDNPTYINFPGNISAQDLTELWYQVNNLTDDLDVMRSYRIGQMLEYLNARLPEDIPEITATETNYRVKLGILRPHKDGEGKLRSTVRYSSRNVRINLLVQILREHLSYSDVKEKINELSDRGFTALTKPPTSVNLVYTLLRNRVMGALVASLNNKFLRRPPQEYFIAVRPVKIDAPSPSLCRYLTWNEISFILDDGTWHLGAADKSLLLYIHPSLEQLKQDRSEVYKSLPEYKWYGVTFEDKSEKLLYEVVIGLPERDLTQKVIAEINYNLSNYIHAGLSFDLSENTGLKTLMKASFGIDYRGFRGSPFSVLCDFISQATKAWDYCAVLLPEVSETGSESSIRVHASSSNFPPYLKDRTANIVGNISGWRQRYRFNMIIEPAVEDDPRLPFDYVPSAAVIPAVDKDDRVVGLLYVAREKPKSPNDTVFTPELTYGLSSFASICGDMITRDESEAESVSKIAETISPLRQGEQDFSKLEPMLKAVEDVVRKGISPRYASHSWIYLLTLNIWIPSHIDPRIEILTEWLYQEAIERTSNFMSKRLTVGNNKLPEIGRCEIGPGQYVFAVLDTVRAPLQKHMRRVLDLQSELSELSTTWLSVEFFPWAISFPYEQIRRDFIDKKDKKETLVDYLASITKEAIAAGPYINRGHEALQKGELDEALTNFETAQRLARDNWYVYKHLADIRMLQGKFRQATSLCQTALDKREDYSSARCLMADCFSFTGQYSKALAQYENVIQRDTRADYYLRYGIFLASLDKNDYTGAVADFRDNHPTPEDLRFSDEPHLEAFDKFERAQRAISNIDEGPIKDILNSIVFHFHTGLAYLQSGKIDKAVEEFSIGRKYGLDDRYLLHLFTQALNLQRQKLKESRHSED